MHLETIAMTALMSFQYYEIALPKLSMPVSRQKDVVQSAGIITQQ